MTTEDNKLTVAGQSRSQGQRVDDDEFEVESNDWEPFFDYLKSANGHEVTTRILKIVEDIKKAALDKSASHAIFEKWLQAIIIVIVIVATSTLSYLGKFETSVGVLFGTLVGYIFGRK
jgi:hypothetical protein